MAVPRMGMEAGAKYGRAFLWCAGNEALGVLGGAVKAAGVGGLGRLGGALGVGWGGRCWAELCLESVLGQGEEEADEGSGHSLQSCQP